ncbi:SCAN domain-containing protein 3 [Trichonephila clavipes]|nr:SCAN domain-containing protein 3 [Trichonephila clavipes]
MKTALPNKWDRLPQELVNYEISLHIAKCGKNHTIGEDLIKPAISAFLKIVLEKDDNAVKAISLSNNTASRRIDEMSEDIETQIVEKLKSRYFSLQMDESTLRDNEVVVLVFARYIDKGEFAEEMVFCKSLETTTSVSDIYDGAPVMMGKEKGCLKVMKDENSEKILAHCVIHRENLVAKNITPVLNEVLRSVIKCINYIKANAKSERLFRQLCELCLNCV